MLIIKPTKLDKTCNKCIVKSSCRYICRDEYDRIMPIISKEYKKYKSIINSLYKDSAVKNLSDRLNRHFKKNKCCPVCGYKHCYCYYTLENPTLGFCMSCLYCNIRVVFLKKETRLIKLHTKEFDQLKDKQFLYNDAIMGLHSFRKILKEEKLYIKC